MPLSKEIAQSLGYLRKKYKVSERDLVSLARKLNSEQKTEESWEDITRRYLKNRKLRQNG